MMKRHLNIPNSLLMFGLLALLLAACGSQSDSGDTAGTSLPAASGADVFKYVTETNNYKDWSSWPADQWNDFTVNLVSGQPHGNVVRIYVNDIALQAAGSFNGALPQGSMIVKENYMGTDPANPGALDALTVMYKVGGFNADAGDWFWLKVSPAGEVDKEGAVDGCIGCHSQPKNQDFVLRYGFGNEPAVSSLGG